MDSLTDIRDKVRGLVLTQVESQPDARSTLAAALRVPMVSVDRMLLREKWDLGLALASADALGMKLHVSSS